MRGAAGLSGGYSAAVLERNGNKNVAGSVCGFCGVGGRSGTGRADRLELCGQLVIGGTTPEISLYWAVRKAVEIPIRVMIRPRYGDFCYTEHEFAMMWDGIQTFRELGADA